MAGFGLHTFSSWGFSRLHGFRGFILGSRVSILGPPYSTVAPRHAKLVSDSAIQKLGHPSPKAGADAVSLPLDQAQSKLECIWA